MLPRATAGRAVHGRLFARKFHVGFSVAVAYGSLLCAGGRPPSRIALLNGLPGRVQHVSAGLQFISRKRMRADQPDLLAAGRWLSPPDDTRNLARVECSRRLGALLRYHARSARFCFSAEASSETPPSPTHPRGCRRRPLHQNARRRPSCMRRASSAPVIRPKFAFTFCPCRFGENVTFGLL